MKVFLKKGIGKQVNGIGDGKVEGYSYMHKTTRKNVEDFMLVHEVLQNIIIPIYDLAKNC